MDVRETEPSDSEAVRNVHSEFITELGRDGYTQEQVNAWAQGCESADYVAQIEADDSHFVVAEDESEIVGLGFVTLKPPAEYETTVDAEVTGVYVHPSVARQGVGM
ncbi:GNAT family N-acetyltransferase [Haladaptatus halobius]|uniref:GNAT family N-acetyltransferase n=1 Tax=Haladaptatus halobius TaxID=2884875 RepID=UPI001D0B1F62|nr:GNAT family N-acetyltransferase [Haladaptatus halobius]